MTDEKKQKTEDRSCESEVRNSSAKVNKVSVIFNMRKFNRDMRREEAKRRKVIRVTRGGR